MTYQVLSGNREKRSGGGVKGTGRHGKKNGRPILFSFGSGQNGPPSEMDAARSKREIPKRPLEHGEDGGGGGGKKVQFINGYQETNVNNQGERLLLFLKRKKVGLTPLKDGRGRSRDRDKTIGNSQNCDRKVPEGSS